MLLRIWPFLFCICSLCSCSDESPGQLPGRYGGVYIDNSLRYGRIYKDPKGMIYHYRYMKAILSNDSTLPLYVNIRFPNVSFSPASAMGKPFRVFLLPETMTPENQDDGIYREQVIPFLDAGPGSLMTVQKTIPPKESATFNFGFLADTGSHLDPLPISLLCKGHRQHFHAIPESAIAQALSSTNQLNLILALDFSMSSRDSSRPYALIPCGSLSFFHP